jgi:murein DD-endopeptidase MepM/ murein hydrolase activator NlpD
LPDLFVKKLSIFLSVNKINIIIFFLLFLITGCVVSNNPLRNEIKRLQKGIIKDDTSFVYSLPYETCIAPLIVQGYFGKFSHKERVALDFKMKIGTKILAARGGIVVRVKEDGDKGGWNKKYRPYGNMIVIEHADSSRAGYWHLQKNGALVNVGDTVEQGQVIGMSGKTGYTAFPHLHFLVWKFSGRGQWQQLATRFQTARGIKYLKPLKRYRSTNQ